MLALIPVRDGVLPAGAEETIAECGGRCLVVGDGADRAPVGGLVREIRSIELPAFAPTAWASALAPVIAPERVVVLPGSPDGRDLGPRLAHALGRVFHAGAVQVTDQRVTVSRHGGLQLHEFDVHEPVVATLQPGVRGTEPDDDAPHTVRVESSALALDPELPDARTLAVHPPDVTTMDLVEARRILGGGAGLDSAERFTQLRAVAAALEASMGATRVVTDRHWVGHERQIGTTGVVVDPELYLSFGVSGAVQHTAGLGDPHHVVSVNLDAHCPMMQMSDLAIVSDANAVLDELTTLLGVQP